MNRENKRRTFEKGYYKTHPCHDSFTCRVCGRLVVPEAAGSGHRNHCPNCLSSLHVDEEPGDRASDCGGVMDPIGVWVRRGGEWAVILGATEGVGKAFCEKVAAGGMSVVMVGRREEKLRELAAQIESDYGVATKVVRADFSEEGAAETVFAATEGLDMGFMSYVACLHSFGKIQDTPWEKHQAMINVNVVTFMKCFYHYMQIFAAQDRGAVINVSSMTGISSSPWNGQYGAGKAYILKMTEAVACECEKTGVDVEVITLGTTLTPSLLSNLPGGPQGEAVMKIAQTPEEVVDEAFEKLGHELSVIAGERNKASVHDWKANHTEDEYIRYMGSFYSE